MSFILQCTSTAQPGCSADDVATSSFEQHQTIMSAQQCQVASVPFCSNRSRLTRSYPTRLFQHNRFMAVIVKPHCCLQALQNNPGAAGIQSVSCCTVSGCNDPDAPHSKFEHNYAL